jgi:hypothetical protein
MRSAENGGFDEVVDGSKRCCKMRGPVRRKLRKNEAEFESGSSKKFRGQVLTFTKTAV